ncbi:MAG TPA: HAD family hydrolase [Candidatus Acidoferrales bacterium]|nr:HAD family hydrolase [Candidatus Acidoferrales bacterium]
MENKLFVFDVGGTLRDDYQACYNGYKIGFETAKVEYPFNPEDVWHLRSIGKYNRTFNCVNALLATLKSGDEIKVILGSDNPEKYLDALIKRELDTNDEKTTEDIIRYRSDFMDSDEAINSMNLYPNVNEALSNLKKDGYTLAIFSNIGASGAIKESLKNLDVVLFSAILSAKEVMNKKPSGEGILKVSNMLGFDIGNVYYVGDTQVDIYASRDAGCKAISVLTGMGTRKILDAAHPDFIFDDVYALSNFFVHKG